MVASLKVNLPYTPKVERAYQYSSIVSSGWSRGTATRNQMNGNKGFGSQ